MFFYLELDLIEVWEIEDICYDLEVFFLEIILKYILKGMENVYFYFEWYCFVFDVVININI